MADGIRFRNGAYDIIYEDPSGKRIFETAYDAAGHRIRDKRAAISLRAQREKEVRDGTWVNPQVAKKLAGRLAANPAATAAEIMASDPTLLARVRRTGLFRDDWALFLAGRSDVVTLGEESRDGRVHILPFFGAMRTDEIDEGHLKAFIAVMRGKISSRGKKFAANSIHNVVKRLRTFFSECVADKKIPFSPFTHLRKQHRTREAGRHELKSLVYYSIAEIEAFISHPGIPIGRHMRYGLQFFTGTRFGESSGLRWEDWNESEGLIPITKQYEGARLKGPRALLGCAPDRLAPVHPELRRMLLWWRAEGFPAVFGRDPRRDDYIVPSRQGGCVALRTAVNALTRDVITIGARRTDTGQTHAFRRAFVTIAEAHGASEGWIERITHNAGGGVHGKYKDSDIRAMRRAVDMIPVRWRGAPDYAPPPTSPGSVRDAENGAEFGSDWSAFL